MRQFYLNLYSLTILAACTLSSASPSLAFGETFTVESYLSQVKKLNSGYQGSSTTEQGALARSNESGLLTAPNAFANVTLSGDSKLQVTDFGNYDRANQNEYQIGLSQRTSFGLNAKLYYDLTYFSVTNQTFVPQSAPISYAHYDARPVFEFTQDLWGNGFGRATQAQQSYLEAQALSSSYSANYQTKVVLANAELAYWQLSISRQLVNIEKEAQNRAQQIYDYSFRRARLHLADEADTLQAIAALETRKLEVQTAQDNERTAAKNFNTIRNISSDEVSETLVRSADALSDNLKIPARAELRADVKAAQQNARAQESNATIQSENDLPTLQVFGSFALNGRNNNAGPSISNSFDSGRNTVSGGVKLQVPLAFGIVSSSRKGWEKETIGAEMTYDKSVFDQEQSWQDLTLRFNEAKRRLALAQSIEGAQLKKLNYEKNRLRTGRTTTYQVLLFEQDYILAEASRVRTEGDLFTIFSQLKLFEE